MSDSFSRGPKSKKTLSGRGSQLGPKAWKHILTTVACGRSGESDSTNRKVIVVDPNPNFGDVLEAIWMLNDSWQKGGDVPQFVGIGFYHPCASEVEKSKSLGMQSYLKGFLLRTWWESSKEAGDPEPRRSAETTVQKPVLQKLAWDPKTGKAIIPDVVAKRFEDSEPSVRDGWAKFCGETKERNVDKPAWNREYCAPRMRTLTPKPQTRNPKPSNPKP